MPDDLRCEYCSKIFSSRPNLKKHQTTAKYCLTLRSEKPVSILTCEYCLIYTSSVKANLTRHIQTCKSKIATDQKANQELKDELLQVKTELALIKEQRDEYKIQASKPRSVTNNTQFNIKQQLYQYQQILHPINDVLENFPEEIDKRYTSTHFLKGQEGSAQLVSEILNRDRRRYITDSNRGDRFYYKDDKNVVHIDDNARMIIEATKDPLKKNAAREYENEMEGARARYGDDRIGLNKYMNKIRPNLESIDETSSNRLKFRKELTCEALVSNQSLQANQNDLNSIDKGFEILESVKPKDINFYLRDSRILNELENLDNEELDAFTEIENVVKFLIDKILVPNNKLIYKYEKTEDRFSYHEDVQGTMTKKYEKDPLMFQTTFFYVLKKFLVKRKPEIYRYIYELDYQCFRDTLVDYLLERMNA